MTFDDSAYSHSRSEAGAETEVEVEALVRAAAGDPAVFGALVEQCYSRVYAVALAHLRQRDAAEDLVQEVFLRAYLALPQLKDSSVFVPWVMRIARNLALNWIRDGCRSSRLVSLVPLSDAAFGELADETTLSPREALEHEEQMRRVREAVDRLPGELREVVILQYSEGLNNRQIARSLGVHASSVGRQLGRAHRILREDLEVLHSAPLRPLRADRRQIGKTTALVAAFALLPEAAKAGALASAGGTTGFVGAAGAGSSNLVSLSRASGRRPAITSRSMRRDTPRCLQESTPGPRKAKVRSSRLSS